MLAASQIRHLWFRRLLFSVLAGVSLCSAVAATTPKITIVPCFSVVHKSNLRASIKTAVALKDSAGNPVQGVTVHFGYRPARTNMQFTYLGSSVSAADGLATVVASNIPLGEYQFQAYAPGTNSQTVFWTVWAQ